MIEDQTLTLLFKLTIFLYACVVCASFVTRSKTSDEFGKRIQGWPRVFRNFFGIFAILMIIGGCIGLGGLFIGWGPARWIFGASIICKIAGSLVLPPTNIPTRIDAFLGETEPFLEGLIVATSFLAFDALF